MTRLSFISFTCTAALGIAPAVAMGQCAAGDTCYTLDFSSPAITVTNGILAFQTQLGAQRRTVPATLTLKGSPGTTQTPSATFRAISRS
jgi:hypothetical protein